ncbi:hypothetical protein BDZ97DRAFT_2065905 [Flammula alnicola]|nr:hypothetical protein BDZ97DRAFT_2065905 [Flammula alnicola]
MALYLGCRYGRDVIGMYSSGQIFYFRLGMTSLNLANLKKAFGGPFMDETSESRSEDQARSELFLPIFDLKILPRLRVRVLMSATIGPSGIVCRQLCFKHTVWGQVWARIYGIKVGLNASISIQCQILPLI